MNIRTKDRVKAKRDLYYNKQTMHIRVGREGVVDSILGNQVTVNFGNLVLRATQLSDMDVEYEKIND
jgi:hypothetical protein